MIEKGKQNFHHGGIIGEDPFPTLWQESPDVNSNFTFYSDLISMQLYTHKTYNAPR